MTQLELAKEAGISSTAVALLERGEASPTLLTALKLALALHVDIAMLIPLTY